MSREQDALAAVLALHWEWRIYDDCGHDHQEGDPGTVAIDDLGIVCQDGYVCSICAECCAGRGHGQTEECASDHTDPCWPCPTVQAIRDAMGRSVRVWATGSRHGLGKTSRADNASGTG